MKTLTSLCSFLLMTVWTAYGAMPTLNVTVSDPAGKVAFKGKTTAAGTFATGKLAPGEYTVQFNSDGMPAGNYALVISAGKAKVMAEAVPAGKFSKGGVAMRVTVGDGLNVTGQVTSGKAGAVASSSGNTKVKIVNGKRWFWVTSSTGSNLGGHWVEEGTPEARNVIGLNKQGVSDLQNRGYVGQPGN